MIPLVIHNTDILDPAGARQTTTYQGATESHIHAAISSSSSAFPAWSRTAPSHRRDLLRNVARLIHERSAALREAMHDETHTPPDWAQGNVTGAIELLEETAGLISEVVKGALPVTKGESVAMVVKEPVGVVLAIAPWNAPFFLGFRAIVAALAAGNTVLFKGSELSPKCHYLIACLFRDAGFPPGVLNFVLHRPEDAPALYELTINDPHVRKCNFTGSTNVGRIIASKAAYALKPVLLELGGKNFALVLDDAKVEQAAEQIILGAVLNNGQICMSTDLVYVSDTLAAPLTTALIRHLQTDKTTYRLITPAAKSRLTELLADARSKGATIHQPKTTTTTSSSDPNDTTFPPTVIENVTPEMAFYSTEAFGPVVGLVCTPTESHALDLVSQMTSGHGFGLSAAIFTGAHFRALQIAGAWRVGAVHINSMTVHDEATLPHGGFGESGFGRFGGKWGVEEFLVERVIVLNP